MKTLTCPTCQARGSGPRFIRRHFLSEECRKHAEKLEFTKQLAQSVKCVPDFNGDEFEECDRVEAFARLATVAPYVWVNKDGEIVDLRKVNYEYAKNIRDWMLKNSYRDTPFDETPQFRNVLASIERSEGRLAVASRALRRKP